MDAKGTLVALGTVLAVNGTATLTDLGCSLLHTLFPRLVAC